jgi:hypothetical protein
MWQYWFPEQYPLSRRFGVGYYRVEMDFAVMNEQI